MEHGDRYWEWRDELLKHPEGRALGGEKCVQCNNVVPPNADWRHRDRHVCSSRCNTNLSRKFGRKLKKLGTSGFELPLPDPVPDPRDRQPGPLRFTVVEADGEVLEFGHLGFAPRPGDEIVRFGETTYVIAADAEMARAITQNNSECIVFLSHESGWTAAIGADEIGRPNRTVWGVFSPEGQRSDRSQSFQFEGRTIRLASETIRDVDDRDRDRDVDWSTFVWIPEEASHPELVWSDKYRARSERRRRTSRSQAAHARRVRVEDATIERFDPLDVYERDGWVCQLCHQPVERDLEYPDPLYPSLDHVLPLAANGEHSRSNTQLAHWICNVRKGAATPDAGD